MPPGPPPLYFSSNFFCKASNARTSDMVTSKISLFFLFVVFNFLTNCRSYACPLHPSGDSSFPLKADRDSGRNGVVEAQRFGGTLMKTSAFFGEDLPVGVLPRFSALFFFFVPSKRD